MAYKPQEGIDYIVDLYAVAGVEQGAADSDIKHALNDRAKEYHPDRLQGTAPEFQEKAERIAKLLNRARGILLDPEKRGEYDEILTTWDGPISSDGIPVISVARWQESKFQGMSAEEVEAYYADYAEKIAVHTGYSPNRLAFLEKMIEQAGDDVSAELRAEYENALLQKDRALAIEEAERSKVLGLPDIEEQNYVAVLGYGEQTTQRLEQARATKEADIQRLALGGVSTRLALLAGEQSEPGSEIAQTVTSMELPAYYEQQAARVQEIANERDSITDRRLSNFEPTYPEVELQTELKEDFMLGIDMGQRTVWLGFKLDIEHDGAAQQDITPELQQLLDEGDFKAVVERGSGVAIVNPMEHIDLEDLIGVALGKYTDKYKPTAE